VSRVLRALPEAFDAAVVVLIHRAPDRVSNLVALLGPEWSLPVAARRRSAGA
jgi:chemotaxis response regulator CheB